ncbi:MAG: ATP-dependent zinc metalloprotease FtsH [Victivallaceae bacterium]
MASDNDNNFNKNNDDDNNRQGIPPSFSGKPSKAAFVWILIFIALGAMIVFQFNNKAGAQDKDQAFFEQEIAAGKIISVKLVPETDRIMYAEWKSKLNPEELAKIRKDNYKAPDYRKYKARIIYSEGLDQMLKPIQREVESRDNWWNIVGTLLPVLLIIGVFYFLFSRQIKMAGKGAMQFGKSRARMIMPNELKTKFDDIAGADEAKEEIKEIVDFLKDPLRFKMLGGNIPKGVLLTGAPGTGKTLLAKAVASEANVPFFSISGSDFVEMFVGVGASRVRDMFEQARKHMPCLIFIDEIDAVGRSRFSGLGGGHDEREQTLNAMLVEMDGLETQAGVIIIAATNRPDVLDPALLRPGRFDRQIVLDLPDIKGRRKILDVHIKNIKTAADVNLDLIARTTPGFSGADLANLCNEAALLAARNNREAAIMIDMEEARDKVRWGRERKSRKISDKERKLTAYHEAGHTLIAMHSENATPVHKVTIIPRGQAYLGATMTMPTEDTYTSSRSELLDELVVLMGGRSAEEIVFKDISTGASSDIEVATRIARQMVCIFGMNDKIGPIRYSEYHEQIRVRADAPPSETYSQETAREIDVEVKKLLDDAHMKAVKMLEDHRGQVELLAQELLDKETLTVAEVRKLIGMPAVEDPAVEEAPAVTTPETAAEAAPRC